MKKILFVVFILPFFMLGVEGPIPGFEDPALLEKVLSGAYVMSRPIETKQESKAIVKSFFKQVSPEAYIDLITDYPRYKELFLEVKEGKLLKANAERTVFDYWLHLVVKVGLIPYDVYAEGEARITYPASVHEETKIYNFLTNYKEQVDFGRQWIRLIPYQNGMLVEDTVHMRAKDSTQVSQMAKKKFMDFFLGYTPKIRVTLGGNP